MPKDHTRMAPLHCGSGEKLSPGSASGHCQMTATRSPLRFWAVNRELVGDGGGTH